MYPNKQKYETPCFLLEYSWSPLAVTDEADAVRIHNTQSLLCVLKDR
jgi:hypothetical protein